MIKIILDKILSGRYLFTIGCLLVFMYLAIKGTLPIDKTHEIILVVLYAYFSRNDRNGGNNVKVA